MVEYIGSTKIILINLINKLNKTLNLNLLEKNMLKFYYNTGPNPMKIALCLEEMGLEYEAIPVDTRKGEQHTSQYLAINPNAKTKCFIFYL